MSSYLEGMPSVIGNLGNPVTILNEFVLEAAAIEGGVRLKTTSLSSGEVQTVDIMDGHTPQKGVDYWTEGEQQEIIQAAAEAIPLDDTLLQTGKAADAGAVGAALDNLEEKLETQIADAIVTPAAATVGQAVAVKTVDETGKPVEWEAVNVVKSVNSIRPDEEGHVQVYPPPTSTQQMLVTDENGEQTWEKRIAYTQQETVDFIAEAVWDGTQLSFPVALIDGEVGDRIIIYVDDTAYPATIIEKDNNSYEIEFDEGVSFPWSGGPFYIGRPGINVNLGGAPLSWCVGKMSAIITTSVVHPIEGKYLGIDIQSVSNGGILINNRESGGEAGQGATSINGGHATGVGSVALTRLSVASGAYAIAGGYGSAKGENAVAFGEYTDAASNNSMVIGSHNITDEEMRYAFIIGNGEKGEFSFEPPYGFQRVYANAHTVDWAGNAWFSGSVYVGGSGQDDTENAKRLVTRDEVIALIEEKLESLTDSTT